MTVAHFTMLLMTIYFVGFGVTLDWTIPLGVTAAVLLFMGCVFHWRGE